MTLCKCGCGLEVINPYHKFKYGHKKKLRPLFCLCGCGNLARPGNSFIHGHNTDPKENSERMKKTHRNWLARNPEDYKLHQSQAGKSGGKRSYELHKEEIIENIKKNHRENKEFYSEQLKNTRKKHPRIFKDASGKGGKKMHREWKERDPEGYRQHQSNASKKANKTIRENKPYIWKDVHFMSREEMEVAKKLLIEPIVNVNCHIRVNGKIIDFFPQKNDLQFQGCFVEYHPWDWFRRTEEEYYNDRKEIIENSQYKGTPLIVLTDIENI